jgi:hypothetical protein
MKFRLLIREAVERLQHQDAEHQHRIIGWTSTAATIRSRQRRIQHRAEDLEINHRREALQRIARRRQGRIPLVHIEEARLPCHSTASADDLSESAQRVNSEVFRSVHPMPPSVPPSVTS